DRIQYVILDNGKKLVSERAEEVEYVMKNLDKLKIDKNFYLMHQLIPPAMRVLGLLGVKEELLLSKLDEKQKSIFEF
ncbi:MAG: DNA polymerase domain-containing protein, partial [Sideroxydans sp.]|nr:DNA polymerase domain-containing protein [Sideroxydans sp.]